METARIGVALPKPVQTTSIRPIRRGLPSTVSGLTCDARAVTPTTGDNDTSIATTAFVQTATAPAFNGVGRNLCHNQQMAIASVVRGRGQRTAIIRWTVGQIFATTDTQSVHANRALSMPTRAAIGDEEAQFAVQCVFIGNAAAGAASGIQQKIENLRRPAGKTVTISFWAKAAAGTPKLGISFDQWFGSGGSPSAMVSGTGVSVTLSTTWTRYTVSPLPIPSLAGKTLGTNNDGSTQIEWCFSSGATNAVHYGNPGVQIGTIQLWGVQLEIGSIATPLEKPDPTI